MPKRMSEDSEDTLEKNIRRQSKEYIRKVSIEKNKKILNKMSEDMPKEMSEDISIQISFNMSENKILKKRSELNIRRYYREYFGKKYQKIW